MTALHAGGARNYGAVEARGSGTSGLGHGEPAIALDGSAGYDDPRPHDDDFSQPGKLYRLLPAAEKQNLVDNIAGAMRSVSPEIIRRQVGHFAKADPAYAAGVLASLSKLGVKVE